MLSLFLKCTVGAAVVLLISLLSRSKAFYIAGLVPLFPTFALIAHVIVSQDKGTEALKQTALFGMWSLIPYFIYLLVVYLLATKFPIWSCLSIATLCWIVTATLLVSGWNHYFS
ncbi:GlpM family protein [Acinetobacter chinensis]|uniref:GlpM family protein n=1 Tax=Acinetobacter chinensis TaxID=2004650 RepID=A0A3B7LYY4_9GAMM|nr:GlpM family protein [Acinetobacter chinensis]AXY58130.1 GlpM family protein [Acinetobacter chinensis]